MVLSINAQEDIIKKINNLLFANLKKEFPIMKGAKISYQLKSDGELINCPPSHLVFVSDDNRYWFSKTNSLKRNIYLFGKNIVSGNNFKASNPFFIIDFDKKVFENPDCSAFIEKTSKGFKFIIRENNYELFNLPSEFKEDYLIDNNFLKLLLFNKEEFKSSEIIEDDSKYCTVCGKILPFDSKKSICKKCQKKRYASKIILELMDYVQPGYYFKKEEFIDKGFNKIKINDYIWTLQEFGFINSKNEKYALVDEKLLCDFIKTHLPDEKCPKNKKNTEAINKTCSICGKVLPITKFSKSKDYCRACEKPFKAAKYLKRLLSFVPCNFDFKLEDISNNYPSFDILKGQIFELQENNLINSNENNIYSLKDESFCKSFLEKYLDFNDLESVDYNKKVDKITEELPNSSKFISNLKDGQSIEKACENNNIPIETIGEWLDLGFENKEPYVSFYNEYLEVFTDKFKSYENHYRMLKKEGVIDEIFKDILNGNSIFNAFKKRKIKDKEVVYWNFHGKKGEIPFNEFYKKYQSVKDKDDVKKQSIEKEDNYNELNIISINENEFLVKGFIGENEFFDFTNKLNINEIAINSLVSNKIKNKYKVLVELKVNNNFNLNEFFNKEEPVIEEKSKEIFTEKSIFEDKSPFIFDFYKIIKNNLLEYENIEFKPVKNKIFVNYEYNKILTIIPKENLIQVWFNENIASLNDPQNKLYMGFSQFGLDLKIWKTGSLYSEKELHYLIFLFEQLYGVINLNFKKEIPDEGNYYTKTDIKEFSQIKYSENHHLKLKPKFIVEMYEEIKDNILNKYSDIKMVPHKSYIAFKKNNRTILSIRIQSDKIKTWLNVKKSSIEDIENKTRDVSNIGHLGIGDYEFNLEDNDDLNYLMYLFKQVYELN